jgi:hypothetical protein
VISPLTDNVKKVLKRSWTEESAVATLKTEINRFKKNGWIAAADLLQHFVDKSDGKLYTLQGAAKDDVMKESASLVRLAIWHEITKNITLETICTLRKDL